MGGGPAAVCRAEGRARAAGHAAADGIHSEKVPGGNASEAARPPKKPRGRTNEVCRTNATASGFRWSDWSARATWRLPASSDALTGISSTMSAWPCVIMLVQYHVINDLKSRWMLDCSWGSRWVQNSEKK